LPFGKLTVANDAIGPLIDYINLQLVGTADQILRDVQPEGGHPAGRKRGSVHLHYGQFLYQPQIQKHPGPGIVLLIDIKAVYISRGTRVVLDSGILKLQPGLQLREDDRFRSTPRGIEMNFPWSGNRNFPACLICRHLGSLAVCPLKRVVARLIYGCFHPAVAFGNNYRRVFLYRALFLHRKDGFTVLLNAYYMISWLSLSKYNKIRPFRLEVKRYNGSPVFFPIGNNGLDLTGYRVP